MYLFEIPHVLEPHHIELIVFCLVGLSPRGQVAFCRIATAILSQSVWHDVETQTRPIWDEQDKIEKGKQRKTLTSSEGMKHVVGRGVEFELVPVLQFASYPRNEGLKHFENK